MVYHDLVNQFLNLPFEIGDRIIKEGNVASLEKDKRFDFLRVPILERISSEDRVDVFNYLRTKVNLGHLTKVLVDEANVPVGAMCRTKLWRPREQGGGVMDSTSEYPDEYEETGIEMHVTMPPLIPHDEHIGEVL